MSDEKREEITRELYEYGAAILGSEVFARAMEQTHHTRTSVGLHTLSVAIFAIGIAHLLEKGGIRVDEKKLVRGALCHDLGIVGRNEKYENNRECLKRHPLDSVRVAEKIVPNLTDEEKEIISRHMWPLGSERPTTKEGMIVTVADKLSAVRDILPGGTKPMKAAEKVVEDFEKQQNQNPDHGKAS